MFFFTSVLCLYTCVCVYTHSLDGYYDPQSILCLVSDPLLKIFNSWLKRINNLV